MPTASKLSGSVRIMAIFVGCFKRCIVKVDNMVGKYKEFIIGPPGKGNWQPENPHSQSSDPHALDFSQKQDKTKYGNLFSLVDKSSKRKSLS